MMRSLFSGVSGLQNHQTRMDVIGNNIANVNTIGFKAGRANFQDMLSQTLQGASGANDNTGGTNAKQIGLGSSIGSIDTIFTDGSTQTTGKQTDLAITGNGFFIVRNGANQFYTRAGNFDFDEIGNLGSTSTGYHVMGWNADASGKINTGGDLEAIVISPNLTMPPKASTSITYGGNLNAKANIGTQAQTSISVYDSLGNAHKVTQSYIKTADNTWIYSTSVADGTITAGQYGIITYKTDGTVDSIRDITPSAVPTASVSFDLQLDNTASSVGTTYFSAFDSNGVLHQYKMTLTNTTPYVAGTTDGVWSYSIIDASDTTGTSLGSGTVTCDNATGVYSFSPASFTAEGNAIALAVGTSNAPLAGSTTATASLPYTVGTSQSDLAITPTPAGTAENMVISRSSMAEITQYGGTTSTIAAADQDGYTAGSLQKKSIDGTGTIIGTFSNNETMVLAQIAMANFSNPGGLTKAGDNMYVQSNNSGEPLIGTADSGGLGKITASALEMSNVDLSQEFSNMIITQRGFQANSKIITTSDEMLEILANLKR
ncbi:hypothetical protein P22_2181 [Propionispora sp. 2/2-37]|uniref:flagellar hook protein FlgE n=1 Tax=Propionispora sp. 2/2-37 TaxID=1677858 RepID=UPI0006BB6399|nr:flagellar hook protein FlgE [Propionispora sp. 2/2-37]CUH96093.1 hypothetical protein P22_2181 [Propionispora sp. 2/2-37]